MAPQKINRVTEDRFSDRYDETTTFVKILDKEGTAVEGTTAKVVQMELLWSILASYPATAVSIQVRSFHAEVRPPKLQ